MRHLSRLKALERSAGAGEMIACVADAIEAEAMVRSGQRTWGDYKVAPALDRLLDQVEAELDARQAMSDDERELQRLRRDIVMLGGAPDA